MLLCSLRILLRQTGHFSGNENVKIFALQCWTQRMPGSVFIIAVCYDVDVDGKHKIFIISLGLITEVLGERSYAVAVLNCVFTRWIFDDDDDGKVTKSRWDANTSVTLNLIEPGFHSAFHCLSSSNTNLQYYTHRKKFWYVWTSSDELTCLIEEWTREQIKKVHSMLFLLLFTSLCSSYYPSFSHTHHRSIYTIKPQYSHKITRVSRIRNFSSFATFSTYFAAFPLEKLFFNFLPASFYHIWD